MSSENQQSNVNVLCAKGCGFYGSPTTRNLCSKCYRETIRKEQAEQLQQQQQQSSSSSAASSQQQDGTVGQSSESQSSIAAPVSAPPLITLSESPAVPDSLSSTITPIPTSASDPGTSAPFVSSSSTSPVQPPGTTATPPSVNDPTSCAPPPPPSGSDATTASPSIDPTAPSTSQDRPEQANCNRCWKCNKRVGLLGFQCRCGYFFCGQHRHADSHACDFDYKSFERQQLSRANKKIVAEKVAKI